ncbi:magnesium chelatase [Halorientalis sp. IM1011]|uniref:AAA family ATPase n=1 Tax=Halorientalis sp. IM1011 TaxID=1932360 RepID=UPI00097CCA55|nr:MoxR family ATPase [Halorientalis sp. IM1011]AQL42265.1 magnesium chelatase [Halorientalis sp. IM1011]
MVHPEELYATLESEVGNVLVGNETIVEGLTVALLTRGHVLLEGVPGVAKTTVANLFATATGLEYTRIQMTPDVLPADVTGTHIYREGTGEFDLQRGPVFANIVVADEINRATPKTQSALLEAMEEETVTIDGDTFALPSPFMVVATQNPLEFEGVYELPEAQRDRFMFKLRVDLPDESDELAMLDRFDDDPELGPSSVSTVASASAIESAREIVAEIYVHDSIKQYIRDMVAATREHPDLEFGGSPRATLALLDGSKARAAIHGREYVIPDDVKALTDNVLGHRVILQAEAELSNRSTTTVVTDAVESVSPPGTEDLEGPRATAVTDGDG